MFGPVLWMTETIFILDEALMDPKGFQNFVAFHRVVRQALGTALAWKVTSLCLMSDAACPSM